jgi:hypothetical protein
MTTNGQPSAAYYQATAIDAPADEFGLQSWQGTALCTRSGIIYGIPSLSYTVLRVDPRTDTVSTFGYLGTENFKWNGGVYDPATGMVFGIPYSAHQVLRIDTASDIATQFGHVGYQERKWAGGVLAQNGKIYCMPFDAGNVLVIHPGSETVEYIEFPAQSGIWSSTGKWFGGVLTTTGIIMGMPGPRRSDAGNLATNSYALMINPATSTVAYHYVSGGTVQGGVLAPNSNVYIPQNSASTSSTTSRVLAVVKQKEGSLFDPNWQTGMTRNDFLFSIGSSPTYCTTSVLAPNGLIYCVQTASSSRTILQVRPQQKSLAGSVLSDYVYPVSTVVNVGSETLSANGGALADNGFIYVVRGTKVIKIGVPNTCMHCPAGKYLSPDSSQVFSPSCLTGMSPAPTPVPTPVGSTPFPTPAAQTPTQSPTPAPEVFGVNLYFNVSGSTSLEQFNQAAFQQGVGAFLEQVIGISSIESPYKIINVNASTFPVVWAVAESSVNTTAIRIADARNTYVSFAATELAAHGIEISISCDGCESVVHRRVPFTPPPTCSLIAANTFCYPNGRCTLGTESATANSAGECLCTCDCSGGFAGTQCTSWASWKVATTVVGAIGGLASLLFTLRTWKKTLKNESLASWVKGRTKSKSNATAEKDIEMAEAESASAAAGQIENPITDVSATSFG